MNVTILLTTTILTFGKFSPPLNPIKRFAMRTAGYTSATKVILAFETPFWETTTGKTRRGGATFTDLAIKQIYYPQQGHNSNSCKSVTHKKTCLNTSQVKLSLV